MAHVLRTRSRTLLTSVLVLTCMVGSIYASRPSFLETQTDNPSTYTSSSDDPSQLIVRLPESVFYVGQAQFLGVTPPQVPPPSPPGAGRSGTSLVADGEPRTRETLSRMVKRPLFSGEEGEEKAAPEAMPAPEPVLLSVASKSASRGFDGINVFQMRYSGVGPKHFNTQRSWTPPDVGSCVGNGFVVQPVNLAIAVYDFNGTLKAGVLSLQQFLGLDPAQNRSTGAFQDNLSDPNCVYDKETGRFFFSVFWYSGGASNSLDRFNQTRFDPETNSTYGTAVLVAASSSGDPTLPWSVFLIPGTNDGISSHNDSLPPLSYPGPTYLVDYPQLAVDSSGLYVSVNQYGEFEPGSFGFFGSSIYAVSKRALLQSRTMVACTRFALPYNASAPATFILAPQPARTAGDGSYNLQNGGTMFFRTLELSDSFLASSIGVIIVSNTRTLDSRVQDLRLSLRVVPTPAWVYPEEAVPQKDGPIPIGKSYNQSNVVGLVEGTAFRMGGVAWADGKVWYSFGVRYGTANYTGVALASVRPPQVDSPRPMLDLYQVFGVPGQYMIFPSVSTNRHGNGVVAFALMGPGYFPTAAYALIDKNGVKGRSIFIAALGKAPLDNFDAYLGPGVQGTQRYGDYQYVNIDENGNAWASVEYVGGKGSTDRANWNTYLFNVDL